MTDEPSGGLTGVDVVVGMLTAALEDALDYCDEHPGHDLPDLLSQALTLIGQRYGSERLVKHRPGSWEAEHVRRLDLSPLYSGLDRDKSS